MRGGGYAGVFGGRNKGVEREDEKEKERERFRKVIFVFIFVTDVFLGWNTHQNRLLF